MGEVSSFREPALLSSVHRLSKFDSGKPELDVFLSQLAMASQRDGFARTFVVCDPEFNVIGYYALCAGTIGRRDAPRPIAGHGAPGEVPVVLLARLAVDARFQGRGLGTMLMHHSFRSALTAAETVAFRAMMVHALDDDALNFYLKFGFMRARNAERTLLISLKDIAHIMGEVHSPGG